MSSPRSLLFILGSARAGGNTEILARAAAECLPERDRQEWIHLDDLALPLFTDRRHSGDGSTPSATGAEKIAQDATLAATDIVIASPLYWYSVSATVKTYLDYWTGWLRVPGLDFRARMASKRMWGVTALADDDRAAADHLTGTLRLSAEYLNMDWRGVLLGYGRRPGDIRSDHEALREAKTFLELDAPGS